MRVVGGRPRHGWRAEDRGCGPVEARSAGWEQPPVALDATGVGNAPLDPRRRWERERGGQAGRGRVRRRRCADYESAQRGRTYRAKDRG